MERDLPLTLAGGVRRGVQWGDALPLGGCFRILTIWGNGSLPKNAEKGKRASMTARINGCIGLVLFIVIPVAARVVPLDLDRTFHLPAAGDIWDIMPDPYGGYIWVQATEPDTELTRLYWGQSGSNTIDSIDLAIGTPRQIFAFFLSDHEPGVVLTSQYGGGRFAQVYFQAFRVADGVPRSPRLHWPTSDSGPYIGVERRWGFVLSALVPTPLPPQASMNLIALVSFRRELILPSTTFSYQTGYVVPNFFDADTARASRLNSSCAHAGWSLGLDSLRIAYSGSFSYDYGGQWPYYPEYYTTAGIGVFHLAMDTLVTSYVWSCFENRLPGRGPVLCKTGLVACTDEGGGQDVIVLSVIGTTLGAVRRTQPNVIAWSTAVPYKFYFPAECFRGNGTEEFLCYDSTRMVLDVLDAATGERLGTTGRIHITSPGARIVARYDSAFRRLAFRDQNELRLYRIGEPSVEGYLSPIAEHNGAWAYRFNRLGGPDTIICSGLCPGTRGSLSGTAAGYWSVIHDGETIRFAPNSELTFSFSAMDTFWLTHPACRGSISWSVGDSSGTIAGPFSPPAGSLSVLLPGPPAWAYRLHRQSGWPVRLILPRLCPGTAARLTGSAEFAWSIAYAGAAAGYDSVVFNVNASAPAYTALDTFWLDHPACSGDIIWLAFDSSGTIAGPTGEPAPAVIAAFTAQGVDSGIWLSFTSTEQAATAEFELWRSPGGDAEYQLAGRVPRAGGPAGSVYHYLDRSVPGGIYYQYFPADRDRYGWRHEHRSLAATAVRPTARLAVFECLATDSACIVVEFTTAFEYGLERIAIKKRAVSSAYYNTRAQIVARGRAATPQKYQFVDDQVNRGVTYFYYPVLYDSLGWVTEHRDLLDSATARTGSGDSSGIVQAYFLTAYPNPFNPVTNLQFAVSRRENVRLEVYDLNGRFVQTVVNRQYEPGLWTEPFAGGSLPSGLYFARMTTPGFTATHKLLLLQ